MKNVVIVNDWACVEGGAASIAVNSAIALASKCSVYFFSAVLPIDERLGKAGVQIICLRKPDILNDTNRLRAISKGLWDIANKKKFEELLNSLDKNETIVHYHTWTKALSPSLYSVTAKLDFHVVITLHDFFCFCPNGGFYNYQKNEICHLKPMSFSCFVCNCDARNYPQKVWRYIRMFIQNNALWKNKKLSFISISQLTKSVCTPLVRHALVYDVPDPVELSSQELNDLHKNDIYLFMARLSPEKGVNLFCQAMVDLNLKGVVLGEGYLKSELQIKYPTVRFVGWVTGEQKQKWLKEAKSLVYTSLCYETFGLSVAEAKSYGIPCIVPDECAAREQIEDGITGYWFKTGNLHSLKEAILKYESSDIVTMQKNIVHTFDMKRYSMESHIQNLVKVYESILSK